MGGPANEVPSVQNRQGIVVALSPEVTERLNDKVAASKLAEVESPLEPPRLAPQDTVCDESMTEAERGWPRKQQQHTARRSGRSHAPWTVRRGRAPTKTAAPEPPAAGVRRRLRPRRPDSCCRRSRRTRSIRRVVQMILRLPLTRPRRGLYWFKGAPGIDNMRGPIVPTSRCCGFPLCDSSTGVLVQIRGVTNAAFFHSPVSTLPGFGVQVLLVKHPSTISSNRVRRRRSFVSPLSRQCACTEWPSVSNNYLLSKYQSRSTANALSRMLHGSQLFPSRNRALSTLGQLGRQLHRWLEDRRRPVCRLVHEWGRERV